MSDLAQQAADLNAVASFLAAPDMDKPTPAAVEQVFGTPQADLLILLGNAVLTTVERAAAAVQQGVVEEVLIAGGRGHSTHYLREAVQSDPRYDGFALDGAPEAVILKELLIRWYGLDAQQLMTETASTNCGANAEETHRLLRAHERDPQAVLLVQDPTMQRRTWASFRRVWGTEASIRFANMPPFVPAVRAEDRHLIFDTPAAGGGLVDRFIELVMGEIPRLRNDADGYGPKGAGYIVAVDIPPDVEAAYGRLLDDFGDRVRWPPA